MGNNNFCKVISLTQVSKKIFVNELKIIQSDYLLFLSVSARKQATVCIGIKKFCSQFNLLQIYELI